MDQQSTTYPRISRSVAKNLQDIKKTLSQLLLLHLLISRESVALHRQAMKTDLLRWCLVQAPMNRCSTVICFLDPRNSDQDCGSVASDRMRNHLDQADTILHHQLNLRNMQEKTSKINNAHKPRFYQIPKEIICLFSVKRHATFGEAKKKSSVEKSDTPGPGQ